MEDGEPDFLEISNSELNNDNNISIIPGNFSCSQQGILDKVNYSLITISKKSKKKSLKRLLYYNSIIAKRKSKRKQGRERKKAFKISTALPQQQLAKVNENSFQFVIDCSFNHLMSQKCLTSLAKQVKCCYSSNRKGELAMHLHLSNLGDTLKDEFCKVIPEYPKWNINIHMNDYISFLEKDKLVYLTAESENILTELSKQKYYIIGGLVDHNYHKGICLKKAIDLGIVTARLPIDDYVKLNTSSVLAVNHVFDILLSFGRFKNWRKAILSCIPPRKICMIK